MKYVLHLKDNFGRNEIKEQKIFEVSQRHHLVDSWREELLESSNVKEFIPIPKYVLKAWLEVVSLPQNIKIF